MPENPATGPKVHCAGAASNCELLVGLDELHAQRCEEAGIAGYDAVVNAMAVGLVIEVWRNGPVEEMHASRRGPDDAAMFAESTALHDEAVKALTAEDRNFGLIGFERHLLDRFRPWAGTGGRTLKDLGYGFLGHYARHVKGRTSALMSLGHHTCVADPAHPAWRNDGRGAQALAEMPPATPSIEQLAATLLTAPSTLPVDVLEWLSDHLLYCAAPPYGFFWRRQNK